MKRIISIGAAFVLLCGCLPLPALASETGKLQFNQDGQFKIIQVTDLQESYLCSPITQEFLYDIAKAERPDLFILTGDNIADNACNWGTPWASKPWVRASIDAFMKVFDRIYREFGIPVTMVFGNHDAEKSGVTRAEEFAMYARHESFIGFATTADDGTTGVNGPHYGTHNLVIYDKTGKTPQFNLWMFDSGDYRADTNGDGYDSVQKPQIDWFKATNKKLGGLPSLAFQHIIVPEIYDVLTKDKMLPKGAVGELNENPCPGYKNWGQYQALSDAGVMALFVGHDHVNTYEITLPGTDLVNSPGTGFGSYGETRLRGARVVTLDQNKRDRYSTRLVTYKEFYPDNKLRSARLGMYQALQTFGAIFDVVSFRPLLWALERFGY